MTTTLTVKNLQNETFTVDCNKDDTVKQLKEKIAAKNDLTQKYNPELLKLLWKGKVMDNEDTLESFEIKPDGFLVLVKETPGKPKPPPKKKPNQGFNNSMGGGFGSNSFMQNPFQSGAFGQNPMGASEFSQNMYGAGVFGQTPVAQSLYGQGASNPGRFNQQIHNPAAATSGNLSGILPEALTTPEDRSDALETLLMMGFEKSTAEKALRASFYNLQTAVDYITSGNIPDVDHRPVVPAGSGLPNASGSSLMQGSSPGPSAARQPGNVAGDMGETLKEMYQMLQNNPDQLQGLKQALQTEHPETAQMIDNDPRAFLEMLARASNGESDELGADLTGVPTAGRRAPGSVQMTLDPDEAEIITRLQELGFDRNHAVEAFLACDRNENLAANYLLNFSD